MTENNTNEQHNDPKAGAAVLTLRELSANIHTTASEITRGEFSQSGAGAIGAAFRKIKDLPDDEMEDVWGEILSICNHLWEKEHIVASIVLIETSSNMFFIPSSMEERIANSINDANDLKIIKNAEEAFDEGDDEKAVRLAADLKTNIRIKYKSDLNARIKSRQRTRKTALWISGVSFASLLVVTGIGIASAVELLKDPPRPELPAFEDSRRIFQDIFAEESPKPSPSNDPEDSASEVVVFPAPIAPINPTDETSPGLNTESQTEKATDTRTIIFGTPANPENTIEATNSVESPSSEVTAETQMPAEEPKAEKRLATRDDCILGYAVVQRAAQLVQSQSDVDVANKKLASFMNTLQDACARHNLDPLTLSLETAMADPLRVNAIAQSIFE